MLIRLLKQVKENVPEYAEAVRLLIFISYFDSIPEEEIPPTICAQGISWRKQF